MPVDSRKIDGAGKLAEASTSRMNESVAGALRLARIALATLLVALPLALLALRATVRRIARESMPIPDARVAGSWFVVHEAEAATLDDESIGEIGFPGSPPQLLRRSELELPPEHPLAGDGGVVIVTVVVGTSGRVVRARVVKGIETPALRGALVRALREFEFAPARLQEKAWPVALPVTFSTRSAASSGAH